MRWLAPKKFRVPSGTRLKSTAERRSLSVLRAAYASDEGLATFTRGTRGGAHNRSGAREAEAGAGTSSSLLNGPPIIRYLLQASLVSYRPLASRSSCSVRKKRRRTRASSGVAAFIIV